jgi:biotin operon repressor
MTAACLEMPPPAVVPGDGHRARLLADLVRLLSTEHTGSARGVKAEQLALRLGLHERMLRTLISAAREDGIAICGRPDSGYFVAATAAELEDTCRFLRDRAMHSLRIEAQLRRLPLPDLLGQLHLPT